MQRQKKMILEDEFSIIGNWIVMCLLNIDRNIKDEQTAFLRFIDERQDYFIALDLNIRTPGITASQDSSWSGDADMRTFLYNYMKTRVDNLSEEDRKLYDRVYSHYK